MDILEEYYGNLVSESKFSKGYLAFVKEFKFTSLAKAIFNWMKETLPCISSLEKSICDRLHISANDLNEMLFDSILRYLYVHFCLCEDIFNPNKTTITIAEYLKVYKKGSSAQERKKEADCIRKRIDRRSRRLHPLYLALMIKSGFSTPILSDKHIKITKCLNARYSSIFHFLTDSNSQITTQSRYVYSLDLADMFENATDDVTYIPLSEEQAGNLFDTLHRLYNTIINDVAQSEAHPLSDKILQITVLDRFFHLRLLNDIRRRGYSVAPVHIKSICDLTEPFGYNLLQQTLITAYFEDKLEYSAVKQYCVGIAGSLFTLVFHAIISYLKHHISDKPEFIELSLNELQNTLNQSYTPISFEKEKLEVQKKKCYFIDDNVNINKGQKQCGHIANRCTCLLKDTKTAIGQFHSKYARFITDNTQMFQYRTKLIKPIETLLSDLNTFRAQLPVTQVQENDCDSFALLHYRMSEIESMIDNILKQLNSSIALFHTEVSSNSNEHDNQILKPFATEMEALWNTLNDLNLYYEYAPISCYHITNTNHIRNLAFCQTKPEFLSGEIQYEVINSPDGYNCAANINDSNDTDDDKYSTSLQYHSFAEVVHEVFAIPIDLDPNPDFEHDVDAMIIQHLKELEFNLTDNEAESFQPPLRIQY